VKDTEFYQQLLDLKFPWTVKRVEFDPKAGRVDVYLDHAEGVAWKCPKCGAARPLYDHVEERQWRHLDTCQYATILHARLPRVDCPVNGVVQVVAPWTEGRSGFTVLFEARQIDLLKACDVEDAANLCGVSWDQSWRILERAVRRGMSRRPHRIPERMAVDEKSFAKRHKYETIVCDLDKGTVEYVGEDRKEESLAGYFRQFTGEELARVRTVTMDMWDPFVAATRKAIPGAEDKIVYDRFHVMRYVVQAVDDVRRQEHRELMKDGCDILKGTRWLWVTNTENLEEEPRHDYETLRRLDLKVARACALKENIRRMWKYRKIGWAERFFNRWYGWAVRSRLGPMKKAAQTLKSHAKNILTYVKHRVTNAVAEGLNSKIQKIKDMACGFRNRKHYRTAIYFHCGGLDMYPRPAEV
jgi:transposase